MIVCVPTYNRPELFERLVRNVAEQAPDAALVVFDDASAEPYARTILRSSKLAHVIERAHKNHGRLGYAHVVCALLQNPVVATAAPTCPLFYLADDLTFVPGGVARALAALERHAGREGCVGVVAHTDVRESCWGLGQAPCDEDGTRSAWQDGAWLARAGDVSKILPDARRARALQPKAGTGVWAAVSRRLAQGGAWWYRPRRSLTHHDDQGISVLNPWWNGRPGRTVHTAS